MRCEYEDKLDSLYAFEENGELVDFEYPNTDVPMWLFVRMLVKELKINTAQLKVENRFSFVYEPFTHTREIEMFERNPYNSYNKQILFFGFNNVQMGKTDEGLIVETRYYPYISFCPDESASIVSFVCKTDWGLRSDYPNWYSDLALVELGEKDSMSVNGEILKRFVDYLREYFPFDINIYESRIIMKHLYNSVSRLSSRIKACEKVLDVIRPKVVIIEEACFLHGYRIPMILACKKRGIVTADIQYASFNKYFTTSYYYGNGIINDNRCKRVFPDYVLTKGEYWNGQISVPSKKFVIGDAFFLPDKKKDEKCILFCVGAQYEKCEFLLDDLLKKMNSHEFTVFLRVHPGMESNTIPHFKRFEKYSSFKWGNDHALSYYLNTCASCIIEHPSTTEYEALALGLSVYAFDVNNNRLEDMLNNNEIKTIHNADEFLEYWRDTEKDECKIHNEYIDFNWKENLSAFLKSVGAL